MKGSPHINGTSNTIVEEFIKGSKEAHHEIKMFDVAHANLHGGYSVIVVACF